MVVPLVTRQAWLVHNFALHKPELNFHVRGQSTICAVASYFDSYDMKLSEEPNLHGELGSWLLLPTVSMDLGYHVRMIPYPFGSRRNTQFYSSAPCCLVQRLSRLLVLVGHRTTVSPRTRDVLTFTIVTMSQVHSNTQGCCHPRLSYVRMMYPIGKESGCLISPSIF